MSAVSAVYRERRSLHIPADKPGRKKYYVCMHAMQNKRHLNEDDERRQMTQQLPA